MTETGHGPITALRSGLGERERALNLLTTLFARVMDSDEPTSRNAAGREVFSRTCDVASTESVRAFADAGEAD